MASKIFLSLLFCAFAQLALCQKTYFIETEKDSQKLYIDNQIWDGEAFYTVESKEDLLQTILTENGHKKEYDMLHSNTNHVFGNSQIITVDTSILSIVKPIELKFKTVGFDFQTHILDYSTYLKDLDHSGKLENYSSFENEMDVINLIEISNQYLIDQLNEYHNMTIGRYKFYTLGKISSIDLYQVSLNEKDSFIQAFVNVEWRITTKSSENLPVFNHLGQSGKIVASGHAVSKKDIFSLAVNDAVMSSLLYFLEEQEARMQ